MHVPKGMPRALQSFYETSPMRESVLCWYPFESGASALDLSGGALTELLCRKCDRVVSDDANDGETFDYAVVLDPEDFNVDVLRNLRARLNERGRLLLAYENPFGLRYWSGKGSPTTGNPFDSLLGKGLGVSKAELVVRMKQAGFEKQKWYYPISDHWFARDIYSENHLPNELFNQRIVPYVGNDFALQYNEYSLYREIIRGGAFEFMCCAYLVEALVSADDELCAVDYAAVTAYREPANQFSTTISTDGKVRKTPLHPDGAKRLSDIARNRDELMGLGVKVLPVKLEGDVLEMPYVNLPTVWDYWVKKRLEGTFVEAEMFSHLDRIRDAIYKASQTGKCFWELVPANCFFDDEKDELIFFDQEYCWEGISPDVAVARAVLSIEYSPVLVWDSHKSEWIEKLKRRYGLPEHWDELVELADEKTAEDVLSGEIQFMDRMTIRAVERASANLADLAKERGLFSKRYGKLFPVADKLAKLGCKAPAIYGYGIRGKVLHHILDDRDIATALIYDQVLMPNKPIEALLSEIDADTVIVSIKDGEYIAKDLQSRLSIPVYTLEELLNG